MNTMGGGMQIGDDLFMCCHTNVGGGITTLMSKGPGKIEQTITAAFEAEPDNAFTVADLCDRAFPGTNRIERKHHVSVIRAGKKLASRRDEIEWWHSEGLGRTLVFFNRLNVMSYAMARLKGDFSWRYRSNDARARRGPTEDDLRAMIGPGGEDHKYVIKGGAWWIHTQLAIAERDDDTAKIAEIKGWLDKYGAPIVSGNRAG